MRSPRHLWTGEWRAESERAREAAEDATALRAPAQPQSAAPADREADAGEEPGGRRGSLILGLVVAALALVGVAFAAGMLLDDGDGGARVTPLPAVSSKPVKPSQGQTRAGAIYAAASPAVVSVRTSSGEGTGFLIDRAGTVVTNAHVVGGSTHVLVRFGQDGDSLDGDVLGTDPSTDLAVVSIEAASIPNGIRPLEFVDSRTVQVGDLVVAIGNPFGLDRTATEGIVSGLGRSIQAPNGFSIDEVIQTDAPINPGNSGGPLLDDGARVIGVNSQIATAGVPGNIGIGFAVPSNTVRQIVPLLKRGAAVPHAWLGLRDTAASPANPNGARVVEVVGDSPAARAGLQVGDIIKRVGADPVQDPEDVASAVSDHEPGDEIEIVVERNGRTITLEATLGTQPTRTP
jgi:putative serine protease PepD